MPGNKFGVGELWDGIKKAVADAWNEVSQKFTGLLKEIGDLVRKNLPAINLVLKIVTSLPGLIRAVLDFNKTLPGVFKGTIKGVTQALGVAEKAIKNAYASALKVAEKSILGAVRGGEKNLRGAFKSAIAPLPKNIQQSIRNYIGPFVNAAKSDLKRIVGDLSKIPGRIGGDLSKRISTLKGEFDKGLTRLKGGVDKTIQGAKSGIEKTVRDANEKVFRETSKISGNLNKEMNKLGEGVKTFHKYEFQKMTERMNRVITVSDQVSKYGANSVIEIQKLNSQFTRSRAETVADLNKLLGKGVSTVGDAVSKDIARAGSEIKAISGSVGEAGKVLRKVLPMVEGIFKIALNAVPIIDGFADYMQFEELNLKLDILISRQEPQTQALSDLAISLRTITSKIEKTQGGGAPTDNREVLQAIAQAQNAINKLSGQSPAASAASIAQEIVGKLPQVNNEAIATAVAAKIPKGSSDAQIATAVVSALAKSPIQATGSSAVQIAEAVKAKLDPSFKAIDKKLPDNGIYRVDQAGIATAVKAKLDPSFQTIDKKLPDNGLFPVDKTAIANTVKATIDPKLTSIESKLGQPTNPNQLQPIQQQITGLGQQISNLTQQTTNISNYFTSNSFSTQQRTYLNDQFGAMAQIIRGNAASLSAQLQAIPGQVNVPKTDLGPVLAAVGDVSAAIGVPQLKKGLSFAPNAEFLKLGQNLNNGDSSTTVSNLPQMMMALAAVPYVRQGLHRLGGSYDRSVMNPALGKTKITDSLAFQKWTFDQIDERLGMPTPHAIKGLDGQLQKKTFRSLQDTIEETNSSTVVALQDLEVVERYNFAIAQDIQKLMQIALQTREDVDVLIDDSGCKFRETKRSHPTHLNLKSPDKQSSLEDLFKQGTVHYVARVWDDSADKNQKLEKMAYDTQIAAMSSKFEWDKTNPVLPLDKSRANSKKQGDEVWRTFVSTVTAPPEGYVSKGNPVPEIKSIENGSTKAIPKPTIPTKKLGQ